MKTNKPNVIFQDLEAMKPGDPPPIISLVCEWSKATKRFQVLRFIKIIEGLKVDAWLNLFLIKRMGRWSLFKKQTYT